MILYFSGTGNSRYAAEYLAKLTEDETVDIGNLLKAHDKGGNFTSEKPYSYARCTAGGFPECLKPF